jgi:hypothetical protein
MRRALETSPSTQWFAWFQGVKQHRVVPQGPDHFDNFCDLLNRVLLIGIYPHMFEGVEFPND